MSWRHLNAVWAAHLEPAGMKLVAATLADRADENGGGIRLSVATIAKRTSMGVRTAQRWLRGLEQRGVLIVEKRSTQHAPTHYRMPIEALHALATKDEDANSEVPPAAPLDQSRGATYDIQGCQSVHPGVPPAAPNPSLSRRKANSGRESGAAASDALARAAAAPPSGVDADGWKLLLLARPELDAAKLAEQAEYHLSEGCPAKALNRAVVGLRLTLHHKGLSPSYKRANGSAAAPRPRKRAGKHVFVPEVFDGKDWTITEGAP